MPQDGKDKGAASNRQDARTARLEAQMRENLKRRKAQARARTEGKGADEGDDETLQGHKDVD